MLFYGTVHLRMTEEQFWNTTPLKFTALTNASVEYNKAINGVETKKEPEVGHIDNIKGWD